MVTRTVCFDILLLVQSQMKPAPKNETTIVLDRDRSMYTVVVRGDLNVKIF